MATVGRTQGHKGPGGMRTGVANRPTRTSFGIPSFVAPSPSHSPSASRPGKRSMGRRTPVLTLALLKLDKNLNGFCEFLQDPTYENVRKACEILHTYVSIAIATSIPTDRHAERHPSPMAAMSPTLSPLTSWFTGGSNPLAASPSSSAAALEGEWEKFSNPLIVFAGLEGIYASLLHAESSELARNLSKLYERTIDDLIVVRETLCDPFLPSESESETLSSSMAIFEDESSPAPLSSYREIATRVASSLDTIMNVCHCRRKLIWQHKELWSSKDSIILSEAAATFQSLLPLVKATDPAGHAYPILTNLCKEVEIWYYLMEMFISVEQIRFLPSIVNAQKVKSRLRSTSTMCIQMWLMRLFQSVLSILPLVFSRVKTSTNALYGFDKQSFDSLSVSRLGPLQDLEAKIGSFLRMEEKNGVTTAVAIVFNGSRSTSRSKSIATLQRGYYLQNEGIAMTAPFSPLDFESSNFPAIYFHCTTQTPSSPRLLRIQRKNSSNKNELRVVEKEPQDLNLQVKEKLSEGNLDWPYTSWPRLVTMLTEESPPVERWHWSQADNETFFHSTPINNNMWFVVLSKATKKSQRSRYRPTTNLEDEIQNELIEIVSSLRFCDILKRAHVLEIRRARVEHDSSFSTEAGKAMLLGASGGGHSDFVELLQSFKEELGLHTPRSKEAFERTHGFGMMSGRVWRSPRSASQKVQADSDTGHHAFFLGEILMTAI
ncbi:hypothetical protein IV203_029131 [Nitzschia inconspicua]|uniref:Uncharacterized protein n=1 Tax=Nitzschia inconspicua TaxID=303405 RepID=A0A9K3Q0H2_9STRA|nr:hypothetical protein IV203_029131 [Nitzschia inconspicua]